MNLKLGDMEVCGAHAQLVSSTCEGGWLQQARKG